MRNKELALYRYGSILILIVLIVVVFALAYITTVNQNVSVANPFLLFAVKHHIWIMLLLTGISGLTGFLWSHILSSKLKEQQLTSKNVMDTLFLFLNKDEQLVLEHLVINKGQSNQADIAKISNMGRVKAHRLVQKMQEKQLVAIEAHGKIRKIKIKENITKLLHQKTDNNL